MPHSFNVYLNTTDVYSVNTAGKDYTWGFDFGFCEDGDYEMSIQFTSGNIAIADYSTNGAVQMSVETGVMPLTYAGSGHVKANPTYIAGSLRLYWNSATVATYVANRTDNHPILYKSLNRSSNFIRVHLDANNGNLIANPISTNWSIMLHFIKV
jgi:hypothetical protein